MSKEKLDIVNEQEAREALADVRKDSTDTDWCLFSYEGPKSQKLVLVGKGNGGVSEMSQHLKDDIVGYGIVRKTDKIDDSITVKFAFIQWLGGNVPRMQKARISVQQGVIRDFIGQYHIDISCSHLSEISDAIVVEKIMLTSGSASRVLDKNTGTREVSSSGSSSVSKGVTSSGGKKASDTGVQFSDEASLKEALLDVRSDTSDTNWVLMTYDSSSPTSNSIVLLGKGSGGTTELVSHLVNNMVGYGLVRMSETIDESVTVKFAFIRFVGANVPRMLRARLGTHSGAISVLFSPYHVSLECEQTSEITDDAIMRMIRNASGTSIHVLSDQEAASKGVKTSTRSNQSYSSSKPMVPKMLSQEQSIQFVDEASLKADIKDVRNDATSTDWFLCGYEGGKGNTIVTLGKGSNGLEEMVQYLKDDIVAYGLLRKTDKIDESLTVKFVHIVWVGENIDRMHRARLGTHKGAINNLFAPYHVDCSFVNKSDISEEIIMQKIQDASGNRSKVRT